MRQKFVFDATPLIHLAKAGLAPLLVDLPGEKFTVPVVVEEVVGRAKESGFEHPDAGIISSLIDDRAARSAARIQGVRFEGTHGVALRAVRRGSVTPLKAEEHVGRLVSSGWRCDAELYAALLRALKKVGTGKGA